MTIEFKTIHELPFEAASWEFGDGWQRFRVGTCEGLWRCTDECYEILVIDNKVKGNGHFEDVLQWFYNSCIRDKKSLRILEVWNQRFKAHLISKRGFNAYSLDDVQKTYKAIKKELSIKSIQ